MGDPSTPLRAWPFPVRDGPGESRRSETITMRTNIRTGRTVIEAVEARLLMSATATQTVATAVDATGVSGTLLSLAAAAAADPVSAAARQATDTAAAQPGSLMYDDAGRVAVDVTARKVGAVAAGLVKLGFQTSVTDVARHLIEGYLPVAAVAKVARLSKVGLLGVVPAVRPYTSVGLVTSQGDSVLEADRARAQSGVTGAGVTVGVLSDSYNKLGTAGTDIANNDLPAAGVTVVQDSTSGSDEGRAMLQIIHDVAPGAAEAFATANGGEANFAANITKLAKPTSQGGAGAAVVVDDVGYFTEPFYQDGTVATAINNVYANYGTAYFSSAGNVDNQAYESANVAFAAGTISTISASAQQYYDFDPSAAVNNQQQITIPGSGGIYFSLQWDQPFYTSNGVTSTLNMYLLNDTTKAVVASATANNIANQQPVQLLSYVNSSTAATKYDVVIRLAAGTTPGRLKYVNYGANNYGDIVFNTFGTYSPTINPHSAAAGAMSVGAVPFFDQRVPEDFSSYGPATILFSSTGARLSAPDVRAKPDVAAPDGADNTVLGDDSDGNGYKNFFGTSAAAPHAAAVAALVRAANPSLTPAQVYSVLRSTADASVGTAVTAGAGLVDAYRAVVAAAPAPATPTVTDGFETGYLNQAWTTYTGGNGRVGVQAGNGPQSGTYQLVQDSTTGFLLTATPVLDEAVLHVNATNLTNVTLAFAEKEFNTNQYGTYQADLPMPASFTGHSNTQGVALSVDGVNWFRVVSLTGTASTTAYQNKSINLSSIAAANGITLTADTQVKFQFYATASFATTTYSFAFDNVAVTGTAAATALILNGPTFTLRRNGANLDVYTTSTATGTPSQSVPLSTVASVTVNGTISTGSNLNVDLAGGDPIPAGQTLTFNGAGAATLTVRDDAAGDAVTVNAANVQVVSPSFGTLPISFNGVAAVAVVGGTGADTVTQAALPGNTGTVQFTGTTAADTLNVNAATYTFPASATAAAPVAVTLGTLNLAAGTAATLAAPATVAGRTVLVLSALNLAGATNAWTARLDLTGNDLVLRNGSLATANNQVARGFAGGAWTGNGIASATAAADTSRLTAVGLVPNNTGTAALYASFDGVSVGTADLLLKYTYYGDATLDGRVDTADYTRVDAGSLGLGTGWLNGDLNYDASTDGSDYTLLDNAFNHQTTPLA